MSLQRIVKITLRPDAVEEFLSIFTRVYPHILQSDGCLSLKLLRDVEAPHLFFTYSTWVNVEALDKYRQSELFRNTWAATRVLFADRADAWSMDLVSMR